MKVNVLSFPIFEVLNMNEIDKNNVRFRASGNFFRSSECLFVEYYDCIQIAWFYLLLFVQSSQEFNRIMKIDEIDHLEAPGLMEYYFNREYRNPIVDLWRSDEKPIDKLDQFLNDEMNNPIFFKNSLETNIVQMIKNVTKNKLVKNLIVYSDVYNQFMEEDIMNKFGKDTKYVTGDFKTAVSNTPGDTTFIFSDVSHIIDLLEIDKLKLSSIMIPSDYRYNYTDGSKKSFIIDIPKLASEYVFKWAIYRVS